ncbi:hypothetical protein JCM11491_002198 [Sporobolomyces phaffii]
MNDDYEPPATTLETLPNELLSSIFSHFSPSDPVPLLSRRLLPFFRAHLYGSVRMQCSKVKLFLRTVQSRNELTEKTHTLVLDARSSDIARDTLLEVLCSLPTLKSFTILNDRHPKWPLELDYDDLMELASIRSYLVTAFARRGWWTSKWPIGPNPRLAQSETGWFPSTTGEGDFAVERSRGSHDLSIRFFACSYHNLSLSKYLRARTIKKLHLTAYTVPYVLGILRNLARPEIITHLAVVVEHGPMPCHLLTRFTSLSHLSLGSSEMITSTVFFDSIRALPLKSLHFGLLTPVSTDNVIEFLSCSTSATRAAPLENLILDNIFTQSPLESDEDEADVGEWTFPEWTNDCPRVGVEHLQSLCTRLGIALSGTTFDGLEIELRTEAYERAAARHIAAVIRRSAKRRQAKLDETEAEAESTSDEDEGQRWSDESDNADEFEDGGSDDDAVKEPGADDGNDASEEEDEVEEDGVYDATIIPGLSAEESEELGLSYEDEHEGLCGCDLRYDHCGEFAQAKGWKLEENVKKSLDSSLV